MMMMMTGESLPVQLFHSFLVRLYIKDENFLRGKLLLVLDCHPRRGLFFFFFPRLDLMANQYRWPAIHFHKCVHRVVRCWGRRGNSSRSVSFWPLDAPQCPGWLLFAYPPPLFVFICMSMTIKIFFLFLFFLPRLTSSLDIRRIHQASSAPRYRIKTRWCTYMFNRYL